MEPLTPEQRTNLKRTGIAIAVLVLVAVGAFSAGRFSAPLEVKTIEVDRWKTLGLTTEDITRNMTFAKEVQKTVWKNVVTTIVVTPDAGTTTTIADNSIERIGSTENVTVIEQEARTSVVTEERERIVEKTMTLQPDWSVGVIVGVSFNQPFLPISGPLIIGVEGERRIIGGFYLGGWLTNNSAGGKGTLKF